LLRNVGAGQSGVSFGLRSGKEYFVDWPRFENCLIVGAPETGKTTLLLHLILQNIENRHGVLVIDPVGDLVDKVLSHIPVNLADRVVYIDPLKSPKLKRSVQINPLELAVPNKKMVVEAFIESLASSYEVWRSAAEMPITDAVYELMETKSQSISRLHELLTNKRAKPSAISAIGNLVYDRSLMKFCDCTSSSVNFEEVPRKRLIVLAKLAAIPESDRKFIAATLLSQARFAALKTFNDPFFVYVDDAENISFPQILHLIRLKRQNFRVVMATHSLEEYPLEAKREILTLCNTFAAFYTDKSSVRKLGDFFDGLYRNSVMKLSAYGFILAPKSRLGMVWGQTEAVHLRTIDNGRGPNTQADIDEIVERSLNRYGRWVG
jgi:hypothetical protein